MHDGIPVPTPAAARMFSTQLTCTLDGRKERVQFDKITARILRLCYGLDYNHVDPTAITTKVISGVYDGVTTVKLDNLVRHILFQGRCTQLTVARPPR
jgi:hypothetical protein